MRRMVFVTIIALCALTACGPSAALHEARQPQTSGPSVRVQIYAAVLEHYLTSGDTSFPEAFANVYVLETARDDAAQPVPADRPATQAISADEQAAILALLPGPLRGTVTFVPDPAGVITSTDGCPHVRDGGILVTVAPLPADTGNRVEVGINGFVACLGATWLTYVVEQDALTWRVTGTTGTMAVA